MRNTLLLNILLAFAWAALQGEFTSTNLIAGFVIGYIAIWFVQFVMVEKGEYSATLGEVAWLIIYFIYSLFMANIRVAISVLGPIKNINPAIVAIPLDIKTDTEITTLANMITLTPGTLSLDVSEDRRYLFVHGMHVDDIEAFTQEIKQGFEASVQEVFQ